MCQHPKSNVFVFIYGCKSFNYRSGTQKYYQMLFFTPGDALLHFQLVLRAHYLQFNQTSWLTWPWHNIPLHYLKKLVVLRCGSLSSDTLKHCPMNSKAFSWIGADTIAWNTSEFILLWSIHIINNTRKPVSLTAIRGTPRHCPRHQASLMRWHVFGSWAIPFFSLVPWLWYWVIFVLINECKWELCWCPNIYWPDKSKHYRDDLNI